MPQSTFSFSACHQARNMRPPGVETRRIGWLNLQELEQASGHNSPAMRTNPASPRKRLHESPMPRRLQVLRPRLSRQSQKPRRSVSSEPRCLLCRSGRHSSQASRTRHVPTLEGTHRSCPRNEVPRRMPTGMVFGSAPARGGAERPRSSATRRLIRRFRLRARPASFKASAFSSADGNFFLAICERVFRVVWMLRDMEGFYSLTALFGIFFRPYKAWFVFD